MYSAHCKDRVNFGKGRTNILNLMKKLQGALKRYEEDSEVGKTVSYVLIL